MCDEYGREIVDERAYRKMKALEAKVGLRRGFSDLMGGDGAVYHWSMPVILVLEGLGLACLAILPLWCGTILFLLELLAIRFLNGWYAGVIWKRFIYWQYKAYGTGDCRAKRD